jgi:co-chaperonin GroES (HSP10)
MNIEQLSYSPGVNDPKDVVMNRLNGELDKLPEIYGSRVLVATAPSPNTLGKSGLLIATDKRKDEGRWQGKCGLVLKLGTTAFETDPRYPSYEWKGPKPQVGDWIFYRTSDAWETGIGGISCRVIWDSDIMGRVTDIESVF